MEDLAMSSEEFDSLERDALQKLSGQNGPSSPMQLRRVMPSYDGASGNQIPSYTSNQDPNGSLKLLPKIAVKFLIHSSGNIAIKFPYDPLIVGACRKLPGVTWSKRERLWIFPITSLSSAEKMVKEIQGIDIELENLSLLVQRAIAAATSVPDIRGFYHKISHDFESKLLPFQRDGVRFILQHGGRTLLGDEMGLGKTLQAIAVTACVQESWPVLVVSPSSLRLQWASMIHQWLNVAPSDISVFLSQWNGSNISRYKIISSSCRHSVVISRMFNIISYDLVPKFYDLLMAASFKIVIADESHYLKNAQAKRTIACVPIIKKAQYALLLSGTPALSRPIELFKQLEALYPSVYKSVHEYGNRFCKGGKFGLYQGASNLEELHNLMKATVMIRRLKKDVISELPMKRRQQVFLELNEKDLKQVRALFVELNAVKENFRACTSKEELETLRLTERSILSKIYTSSAEAKISGILDYLGTVIEAGCKFLIYAHHQQMLDAIHDFLLKKKVGCVRIDGNVSPAARETSVAEFQEKESIKAAVLSIKVGGVGFTLTAASVIIFAELVWTPGDLIQAEDRAHRIGQISSVNVYYLLANDTIDDIIWEVVQSKLENLGQMLDGKQEVLEVSSRHQRGSPSKQKTLDSFMKRCITAPASDHEQRSKHSRH